MLPTMKAWPKSHLDEPITRHMRTDYIAIPETHTAVQALAFIRERGESQQALYFYVTNALGRLLGVLPTRKLLAAALNTPVTEVMETRVVAVPESFTVLEACELFVLHRLLAFPVVSADRRLLGVVDVGLYTDEMHTLTEKEHVDGIFESLGIRLALVRQAAFLPRFRLRFSWLTATLLSGTCCALLASLFHQTLAASVVLSLFLTLVLGLGESVCVQSLSLAVEQLRYETPTWAWYLRQLRQELPVAASLAAAAGALAGGVCLAWQRAWTPSLALLLGIFGAITLAAVVGASVPALFHRLRLDLKVASGPVALGLADLITLTCYLAAAALLA